MPYLPLQSQFCKSGTVIPRRLFRSHTDLDANSFSFNRCSTKLYVDLAEAARPQQSVQSSSQLSGGTGEKLASYFRRSSPINSRAGTNTRNLDGASFDGLQSQSQSPKRSLAPLGTPSGYASSQHQDGKSLAESTDLEVGLAHPFASPTRIPAPKAFISSSGLPFVPSDSVASPPSNHHRLESLTSGHQLNIAIERSCQVRSELVPTPHNFMANFREEEEEEYPGLRRQSN